MTEEQRKNLALAREINRDARSNPGSPYAGKYVGVLHQQVVAVANTLDELEAQLAAVGAGARDGVCIEASADYDQAYCIWSQSRCLA